MRRKVDICALYSFRMARQYITHSSTALLRYEDKILSGNRYPLDRFKAVEVAETRALDENTLLDLDRDGNTCAITIEHAKDQADMLHFSFERVNS